MIAVSIHIPISFSFSIAFPSKFPKTTRVDGKNAGFVCFSTPSRWSKKAILPLTNSIFACGRQYLCHAFVSGLAGISIATTIPFWLSSYDFAIHNTSSRLNGGFTKALPILCHSCFSPSSSFVKNFLHFAVVGWAQGSRVKLKTSSNLLNSSGGVAHS